MKNKRRRQQTLLLKRDVQNEKERKWNYVVNSCVKEKIPWEGEFTLRSDPWAVFISLDDGG